MSPKKASLSLSPLPLRDPSTATCLARNHQVNPSLVSIAFRRSPPVVLMNQAIFDWQAVSPLPLGVPAKATNWDRLKAGLQTCVSIAFPGSTDCNPTVRGTHAGTV